MLNGALQWFIMIPIHLLTDVYEQNLIWNIAVIAHDGRQVYDNWPHKHHLVMFAYLSTSSPSTTTPRYHGRYDYGVAMA